MYKREQNGMEYSTTCSTCGYNSNNFGANIPIFKFYEQINTVPS